MAVRCEVSELPVEQCAAKAIGARFWLVEESYRGRPGTGCVGIALRRAGVVTAEQAFTDRRDGAR